MINKIGNNDSNNEAQSLWQEVSLNIKPVKESEKNKDENLIEEEESAGNSKKYETNKDQDYVVVLQERDVETHPYNNGQTIRTLFIEKKSFVLGVGVGSALMALIILLLW